jgi:hypothetical protein
MKFYLILFLPFFYLSCNTHNIKTIEFQKLSSSNPDNYYLNNSTSTLKGKVKPNQIGNKVFISYQLSYFFDTAANLKLEKTLFLGEPNYYGHYSENIDTLTQELYKKTKLKVDSLQKVVNSNLGYDERLKKGNTKGKQIRNAVDGELLLELEQDFLNNKLHLREYAGRILEDIKKAKRLNTFPFLYENPHYKSRLPSFNAYFVFKLYDDDGFEISSYQTEKFFVSPLKENFIEGKIELDYKKLATFEADIFLKAKKILVNVIASN